MDPWIVLPALVGLAVVFVVATVGAATFTNWRRPWCLTCPRAGTKGAPLHELFAATKRRGLSS